MGSFRQGNVEHVLLNSVTREAALAGQGAERALGEPCSLTKTRNKWLGFYSFFFFHFLASSFPFSYHVSLFVLTHVIIHTFICHICHPSLIPNYQSPLFFFSFCGCIFQLLINHMEFVQQGIHNELFPHSYNPFKHATSSKPVISARQHVRYSSSHLVSLSVRVAMVNSEELSLHQIPWQQGLLNVYVG